MISLSEQDALRSRLRETIESLYREGYRTFLSGGALGFDTIAAQETLSCRENCPGLRLKLVLPCRSQADRWAEKDREAWRMLQLQADEVLWLSDDYYDGCMLMRNRFLVAHASVCVCYLKDRRGGTGYTVGCAWRSGLEIVNLAMPLPAR